MGNRLVEIQQHGQSIWYDNISRGLVLSGRLAAMVDEDGLRGVTSNPAIFEKAMGAGDEYLEATRTLVAEGVTDPEEIFERLAVEDIRMAADVLRGAYDETGGTDGFVSLEVSPHLAHDTEGTLAEARRLWSTVDRDNLMIKVPATAAGLPAIERLIADGINVNVTLLFAVDAYAEVAEAYLRGLERRAAAEEDVSGVASVASFFVSRIDGLVDTRIAEALEQGAPRELAELRGRVAIANAKVAYATFRDLVDTARWQALADRGARVQRVLWASTSTKSPDYPRTLYVDELIGPDTVNTLPAETFEAFKEEGTVRPALVEDWERQLAEAHRTLGRLEAAGIAMKDVTDRLLADGVRKFVEPYEKLLATIERRRGEIRAA